MEFQIHGPYLYKVVLSGVVDISTMNIPDLLNQQTPKGNNVLHIVAGYKQISVFQDLRRARWLQHSMFWTTNKMGDTPLHVAARVGCDKIVKFLIEHAKARAVDEESRHRQQADDDRGEAHKILLRMINLEMDTALHVAVRYGHFGVVRLLLAADPELCGFTNCADESPLFLATRQGFLHIARLILHEGPTSPSFRGFNGITALHIVVSQTSEEAKGKLYMHDITVYPCCLYFQKLDLVLELLWLRYNPYIFSLDSSPNSTTVATSKI